MKSLYFLFFFICFSCTLSAQSFNLSGQVISNGTPVRQATVILRNAKDSTLIKGINSNQDGRFSFQNLQKNDFILIISSSGFRSQNKRISLSGDLTYNFNLQADTLVLKEVKIVSKKPFMTKSLDKTIINIENSVYQHAENGYSLFNVIPGVVTDKMGINYGGQRSVLVYIDDRKLYLQGDDLMRYLKSIPSEDIKTYEIRTVSGAEYEGNSTGVIINITLKKNTKYGLTSTLTSGFEQTRYGQFNNGILLNYKTGKFNLKLNYNYFTGKSFSDDNQDQLYYDTGIRSVQSNKYLDNYVHLNNFTFGIDYVLSKNQLISVDYQSMIINASSITNAINDTYSSIKSNTVDSFFLTKNNKYILLKNRQANFLYRINLDSLGSKIDMTYSYVGYRNIMTSDLANTFFYGNNTEIREPQYLKFINPTEIDLSTGSISIIKTLKKDISLQLGAKYNYSHTDNQITYYDGSPPGQILNEQRSNAFVYNEKIFGLFGTFSKTLKIWSYKLGLRGEYTSYNGKSTAPNSSIGALKFLDNKRWDFFPSLFVQAKPSQEHVFSFAYSRKIVRPSYNTLNPFEDVSDPYNVSRGNPYLVPYFTHTFEFNYIKNSIHNFTLFYTNTRNIINTSYSAENRVIIESYANLNNEQKLGLSYSTTIKPTSWWEIAPYGSITYTCIYVKNQEKSYAKLSPNIFITNRFSLKNGYYAEVNGNYVYNNFFSIYDLLPQGKINFAFKKSFLNDKLSVNLNLNDPFNLTRIGYDVNETTFRRNIRRTLSTRSIAIGISYTFSRGKKKITEISKELNNDEEKSRL
ncbi:hypothetical protein AY601_3529 [Pedobacter cryoconitis]|uniref:Outer membrane protein beta-barrel domain-containing protein n=1 Tax=Pedobacter cryoconitis TaxID=188932 RepID=A0A127VGC9_9SPHI|nr:outer membrane beta-barrel family protein [Pedobacter cryoconitis]AMQ00395.1 hypothetical protein AY601_3529 [Pedobacter cryoconitis]